MSSNCVRTELQWLGAHSTQTGLPYAQSLAGPGLRRWSPWPRPATRSSSPLQPSSTPSSSSSRPSCVPRCPTATWPRSSSRPSPRSWKGSKPGASPGPRPPGRRSPRATPPRERAASRPRSGELSTSVRGGAAVTWTSRADGALQATDWSSTTGIRSGSAVATRWRESRCSVAPITTTWPRSTTAAKPWLGGVRGTVSPSRRPSGAPGERRVQEVLEPPVPGRRRVIQRSDGQGTEPRE